jgi:hypothetical protein
VRSIHVSKLVRAFRRNSLVLYLDHSVDAEQVQQRLRAGLLAVRKAQDLDQAVGEEQEASDDEERCEGLWGGGRGILGGGIPKSTAPAVYSFHAGNS